MESKIKIKYGSFKEEPKKEGKQETKPKKVFFNPIDKILKTIKENGTNDKNAILFNSGDEDVDLRSDLTYPEDVYVCSLIHNDKFLVSKGLKPVYSGYIKDLLRKRVSLDRLSRKEFVDVNKKDFVTDDLSKLGTISNLTEVRK